MIGIPRYSLKQSKVIFQERVWQTGTSPHILVNAAPWCAAATLHWPKFLIMEGQKCLGDSGVRGRGRLAPR